MVSRTAVAVLLCSGLGALLFFTRQSDAEFEEFITKYQKTYSSQEEYAHRRALFYENAAKIQTHNSKGLSWRMGVTEFADLTAEEFKAQRTAHYLGAPVPPTPLPVDNLPPAVDWQAQGAVSPIKNQGMCGSCWSFSTTGSIEGAHFLATGNLVSLSEQQILSCSFGLKYDNFGCLGGQMTQAFQYVIDAGGLETESEWPYDPYIDLICDAKSADFAASISSYNSVPSGSQLQLKAAVAQQPVSVAVEADQSSWQLYKGGIISSDCGQALDHGVLAVGYGSENGVDYWLVKNSWGEDWGENGFLRILRNDTDTTGGLCGIALDASYPLV